MCFPGHLPYVLGSPASYSQIITHWHMYTHTMHTLQSLNRNVCGTRRNTYQSEKWMQECHMLFSPRFRGSQCIYLQLLRTTRLKNKGQWVNSYYSQRWEKMERLSAPRGQKGYPKPAQGNAWRKEEDRTLCLLGHHQEPCSDHLNTNALDARWTTWMQRF